MENVRPLIKCNECGSFKSENQYSFNGRGILRKICNMCKNKRERELYHEKLGSYIYLIRVDGEVWWIGSTNNIKKRINNHRTNKGGFVDSCKKLGLNLNGRDIVVWVCDLENQGIYLNKEDLLYHEHRLIRQFKVMGEPLINNKDTAKFVERERYIDEIIWEMEFEKTDLKILYDKKHLQHK